MSSKSNPRSLAEDVNGRAGEPSVADRGGCQSESGTPTETPSHYCGRCWKFYAVEATAITLGCPDCDARLTPFITPFAASHDSAPADSGSGMAALQAALARYVTISNGYCTACHGRWLFDGRPGQHQPDCPALLLAPEQQTLRPEPYHKPRFPFEGTE